MFDVDIQDGVPPLKLPFNATGQQSSIVKDCAFRFANWNSSFLQNSISDPTIFPVSLFGLPYRASMHLQRCNLPVFDPSL